MSDILAEPQAPIVCQIIGFDRCACDDLVVKHNAPVLAMCRKLIEAGYDPERSLEAYRGETLCLKIRTIAEGARLTVEEGPNGPRLVPFRPARTCVTAPPMRSKETPAIVPYDGLFGYCQAYDTFRLGPS